MLRWLLLPASFIIVYLGERHYSIKEKELRRHITDVLHEHSKTFEEILDSLTKRDIKPSAFALRIALKKMERSQEIGKHTVKRPDHSGTSTEAVYFLKTKPVRIQSPHRALLSQPLPA